MAGEERTLKRRHLIYYLEVFNDESDEILGHVVDITTKGIKLVSKKHIETKKNYTLRMVLPEEHFKGSSITFDAISMWSDRDVNPDFFVTGFQTSELDKKATNTIKKLVVLLGFND